MAHLLPGISKNQGGCQFRAITDKVRIDGMAFVAAVVDGNRRHSQYPFLMRHGTNLMNPNINNNNIHNHSQLAPNHDDSKQSYVSQRGVDVAMEDGLAMELNKLSIQEREQILHDIHGVSEGIVETPELMESSLKQMEMLLHSKRISKSKAYQIAESLNPSYVQDPAFRLLFLRAEEFNVEAATKKLQDFMTLKLELFGEDKLCRAILLEDLSKDDLACLENGHVQFLQQRDQAGRAVKVIATKYIQFVSIENEMRQLFYQCMAMLEDEETQKNGIVSVPFGTPKFESPMQGWKINNVMSTLPYRVQGFHIVQPQQGFMLRWMNSILEKRSRFRIRNHAGTYMEVMYSLMSFGIPTMDFPIVGDNFQLLRKHHLNWIESRRELECSRKEMDSSLRSSSSLSESRTTDSCHSIKSGIFLPSSKDVLFGRGRPFQEHPGNVRFSLIIDSLQPRYEVARRSEKTVIAEEVVKKMKSRGGRFLRRLDGCWEEVSDIMAREKVSQAFRSLRPGRVDISHSSMPVSTKKALLENHPLNKQTKRLKLN